MRSVETIVTGFDLRALQNIVFMGIVGLQDALGPIQIT